VTDKFCFNSAVMHHSNCNTRVLVPSGVLGLGFDPEALARGVAMQPDIICIDGGSTDSGPYYLGKGTSKYARSVCKSEWRQLMLARAQLHVPLVIGTCGTCGTDSSVNWMLDITRELASELGQTLNITCLYSSQQAYDVIQASKNRQIVPLPPVLTATAETSVEADSGLSESLLNSCCHIVALAGAEQINAALATGADIVLAGRTTDTAIIAALPLSRGAAPGAAWHAAKIVECGALCSTHPATGVVVVDIDENGFTVQAASDKACCTPESVSAHMLYENADPFKLHEPGGLLDVSNAQYSALDERRVRVVGSLWQPASQYTVKLEGARIAGYQTISLSMLRDKRYVREARSWSVRLHAFVLNMITSCMALDANEFDLEFRLIGDNAILGDLETTTSSATEIGVLGIVTAEKQSIANEIAQLINPYLLHFPLTENEPLPSFAFPFSPAETPRGALYDFCLNHVMVLDNPMEAFRLVENPLPNTLHPDCGTDQAS